MVKLQICCTQKQLRWFLQINFFSWSIQQFNIAKVFVNCSNTIANIILRIQEVLDTYNTWMKLILLVPACPECDSFLRNMISYKQNFLSQLSFSNEETYAFVTWLERFYQ